jgi:hypothetical protein
LPEATHQSGNVVYLLCHLLAAAHRAISWRCSGESDCALAAPSTLPADRDLLGWCRWLPAAPPSTLPSPDRRCVWRAGSGRGALGVLCRDYGESQPIIAMLDWRQVDRNLIQTETLSVGCYRLRSRLWPFRHPIAEHLVHPVLTLFAPVSRCSSWSATLAHTSSRAAAVSIATTALTRSLLVFAKFIRILDSALRISADPMWRSPWSAGIRLTSLNLYY